MYDSLVGIGQAAAFHHNEVAIVLAGGLIAAIVLRKRTPFRNRGLPKLEAKLALRRVAGDVAMFACVLLALGFVTRLADVVPRGWFVAWLLTLYAAAVAGRWLIHPIMWAALGRGFFIDRVAIVGGAAQTAQLTQHIRSAGPAWGVKIVKTFTIEHPEPQAQDSTCDELFALAQNGDIDRVILALPSDFRGAAMDIIERLKGVDVETSIFPSLYVPNGAAARIGYVAGAPLILVRQRPIRTWGLLVKSSFDRTMALLALIVLSPLMTLIAVAIKLDSPGPVIFRQQRHGRNNTVFTIWKFRTMVDVASDNPGSLRQTARGDSRVTAVGQLLRKTSFDELPQIFNVLNGTMSLVGPRPHAVAMRTEDLLGDQITPRYPHRHSIRPGITGWAQIKGHRGATETATQICTRVDHDLYYIENWCLWLDLKILLITPVAVLFRRDNAF